jgi:cytochrome P450
MTSVENAHSADPSTLDYLTAPTFDGSTQALNAMREQCPVAHREAFGGHWVMTGYEEVTSTFRDWESFSSARYDPEICGANLVPRKIRRLDPLEMDPPEWRDYRQIIGMLLAPRSVEKLMPRMTYWTGQLIDKVIDTGRMDVIYDLASPLPAAVVLEWLQIPREHWRMISHIYHDLIGYPVGTPEFEKALIEQLRFFDLLTEEIAARRAAPGGDDPISYIVNHLVDAEPMDLERAHAVVSLFIGGGVETTTSLIAAGILHLGRNPQDRQRLLADPGLLDHATEELLRVYPPARSFARTAVKEAEVGGCPIKVGDRVMLSQVGANRDPRQFEDPEAFVIDRFPNRHVTFGAGIHRCPGSHLARLEFKECMRQFLARIPDYRVVEEEVVEYPNWTDLGGWQKVVIEF